MSLNRLSFFASVLLLAWAAMVWGTSTGPPSNRSGVNGITCSTSGCHTGIPDNTGGGDVSILGLPSQWSPSTTYPLTVTVSQGGQSLFGFQMTAVDSSVSATGTFTPGSGTKLVTGSPGGIEHSFAKAGSGTATFTFDWTSPSSSSVGDIRFNVAGNAADGSFNSAGDFIYSDVMTVSTAAQITQNEIFYFPHIADGGSFKTTLFITNPSASSAPANVTITFSDFADSGGTPIVPRFLDNLDQQFPTGTIDFQLAGGESRQLVSTADSSTIGVGFATVASDIPVTGSAIFSQFSGANLIAEAGVRPSSPVTSQAIFVDEAGFLTAFAYANPSPTQTVNITFTLLDAQGQSSQDSVTATLTALNHSSLFIRDLFSNTTGHIGTMQITSDVAVTVVSLRFKNDFSIFTSVPPFALTQ
jgi:hypothetical protein